MSTWKDLQNGSDIRGVALEGIKNEPITLTNEIARSISWAFSVWLKNKYNLSDPKISVGHDSRLSANDLKQSVCEGLEANGCIVGDCGLASTPAMFMSTIFKNFKYDGAIMLTASHLPYNRNGFKFFTNKGGLDKSDINEILSIAENRGIFNGKKLISTTNIDIITEYSSYLVKLIQEKTGLEQPLNDLKIIVDAGNGAGGFFVEHVLIPLGADTEGSKFLEPDGLFPNHIPNPEDSDAMNSIIYAVKKHQADFGIIFDTDVDRAGAVDKNGIPINRNRFIALMSSIVLEEYPNTTIVTDSITSTNLNLWIKKLGGIHHRFKRGYKNVINESIRLNNNGICSELALETSGHGALRENYYLDDGAYQIAKILIKIAQMKFLNQGTIDQLIKDFYEPDDAVEFRPKILCSEFSIYADQILNKFNTYVQSHKVWSLTPNNHEGVHASTPNGWILMRKSLHDPQIPINIESSIKGGTLSIKNEVLDFLSDFELLEM